nr:hypothetical protein [Tanacetum cinerariifolium]
MRCTSEKCGAQVKNTISKTSNQVQSTSEEANLDLQQSVKAQPKKVVAINQPQICKNKGCGQTFKEIDNHETACNHHPGPVVFHDRLRGEHFEVEVVKRFGVLYDDPIVELKNLKQTGLVQTYQEVFEALLNRVDLPELVAVTDAPKQLPATLNSGVYPDGPPVPIRSTKIRLYVDIEEVSRGSHDMPAI